MKRLHCITIECRENPKSPQIEKVMTNKQVLKAALLAVPAAVLLIVVSCLPTVGPFSPTTKTPFKPTGVSTNFTSNFFYNVATALTPAVTGLNSPMDICFDPSGNFYVCDAGNNSIRKFDSSDAPVTSWGTTGTGVGQFNHPAGIVYHPAGYIFVSDRSNNRIQRFLPNGSSAISFGSVGTGDTQFKEPIGMVVDKNGILWICDSLNYRIKKYDVNGTYLGGKWGSYGTGNGQFKTNVDIAIDISGNFHVSDSSNHRIQIFDSFGNFQGQFGTTGVPGVAFGDYDTPWGLAFDNAKKYRARTDMVNNRLYIIDHASSLGNVYGSSGPANNQFSFPRGVSFDNGTNIYICDSAPNNRICKWNVFKLEITTNIITNFN